MNIVNKIFSFSQNALPTTVLNLKNWSFNLIFNTYNFKNKPVYSTINKKLFYTNINNLLLWLVVLARWVKTRTSYALNSWVYTTNHKRIAINYFNFVIVAGTAGMALATVIRLEFAYPGVGILAVDSIQYLSIATAHVVIMVFFMIMPAIFGAFGNFLLPTQLGVHDVAFPRLNSAAFWFLPGGLLMLCQLVCVDRRYQRMNCFNIRELQGILKRKFFPDLINLNDHHNLMETSMIGLRFKYNNNDMVRPEKSLFYNFGTTNTSKQKNYTLENYLYSEHETFLKSKSLNFTQLSIMNLFNSSTNTNNNILPKNSYLICLNEFYNLLTSLSLYSLTAVLNSLLFIKSLVYQNLLVNLPYTLNYTINNNTFNPNNTFNNIYIYSTSNLNNQTLNSQSLSTFCETTSSVRYNKYNNALVGYDYKSGHYLCIWDQLYPSLSTSFIEVTRVIRKAPWFFSDQFTELLKNNYSSFFNKFTTKLNLKLADVDNWYSSHVNPTDSYFNLFFFF